MYVCVVDVIAKSEHVTKDTSGGNSSLVHAKSEAAGELLELLNRLKRDELPTSSELRDTLERVLRFISPECTQSCHREPTDDISNVSSS